MMNPSTSHAAIIPIVVDDLTVFVFVSDVSGNTGGVAGATVTLGNQVTTSDAAGNFVFQGVPPGTYTISLSKPGWTFSPAQQTVTVSAGAPASVTANFSAAPPTPSTPINTVYTLDDVLVKTEKRPWQGGGYQLIYEIDTSLLGQVPATAAHPYWYRYYRKTLSIPHADAYWDPYGKTEYRTNPGSWYPEGWHTVNPQGWRATTSTFACDTSFDTRDVYASRVKNTGAINNVYFMHHYRSSIGPDGCDWYSIQSKWLPGASSVGANYWVWNQPTSSTTLNFRIETYQYRTFEADSAGYWGVGAWRRIIPGEVTADGWGIVPADDFVRDASGRGVQWIYIKPKGAQLRVNGIDSCQSTGVVGQYPNQGDVPCIMEPNLWVDANTTVRCVGGKAVDAAGYYVRSLMDACRVLPDSTYDNPAQLRWIASQTQEAYGDPGSIPDYDMAGTLWWITPEGTYTQITFNDAVEYLKVVGVTFMNGSINSLNAALTNASRISDKLGKGLIMIYMAQSIAYPSSPNGIQTVEKAVLRNLLAATAGIGREVTVIGHSWSGHVVLHEAKTYTNVNLALVNPAQKPFSAVADQYLQDLRESVNKRLAIIAGGGDWVSMGGMGQWHISYQYDTGNLHPECVNCEIRDALATSPAKSQVVIGDRFDPHAYTGGEVRHGMKDMMDAGAATYIPRPAWWPN